MKNGTAKTQCSCPNEFQDKLYGVGVRVCNATAKQDDKQITVRCTVCGALHQVPKEKVK